MTTEELIYKTAMACGMPSQLSKFIVAQAQHETTNFTSNVYKLNNNLFGYKFVGQKLAKQGSPAPKGEWKNKNTPGYYAKYATIEDSVKELCAWINRRKNEKIFPSDLSTITSPYEYASLLKKANYYGDSVQNYATNLTRYYKKLALGGILLFPLLLGVAFFFLAKK